VLLSFILKKESKIDLNEQKKSTIFIFLLGQYNLPSQKP